MRWGFALVLVSVTCGETLVDPPGESTEIFYRKTTKCSSTKMLSYLRRWVDGRGRVAPGPPGTSASKVHEVEANGVDPRCVPVLKESGVLLAVALRAPLNRTASVFHSTLPGRKRRCPYACGEHPPGSKAHGDAWRAGPQKGASLSLLLESSAIDGVRKNHGPRETLKRDDHIGPNRMSL